MKNSSRVSKLLSFLAALFIGVTYCSTIVFAQSLPTVNYEHIDKHVLSTPEWAKESLSRLAAYLIEPAKNEKEKARAIFRWITQNIAYDSEGYFSGDYGDLSPGGVLKSGVAVCSGYSMLFNSLGQEAGLEVVNINGYSKGYDYEVGESVDGKTNHAWNAVKIDGKWHLLDATWGSGYLNENGEFVREFDEHYFLTPPQEYIYGHLPENQKWQLLDRSISSQEYKELAYLQPPFFQSGLSIISHPKSVIETENRVTISLSAPDNALLLAQLEQNNNSLERSLTFAQKDQGEYKVHALFPRPGEYTLRLFTKLKDDPGKYQWAMDYKIQASKGTQEVSGFPEIYGTFVKHEVYLYGPMEGQLKSGSTLTFKLRVPGAENVAVIIDGEWNHLHKDGELFEGEVVISQGDVGVYAKFPDNSQYSGLVKYVGF